MKEYKWSTQLPHADNNETMRNFMDDHFENVFSADCFISYEDSTYAEVTTPENVVYSVRAMGDGDFCNHKVLIELLNQSNDTEQQ